jgi:protein SCO1/2
MTGARRSWSWWAAGVAGLAGLATLLVLLGSRRSARSAAVEPSPPPVLGTVPDFELVERRGAAVRRADLAGQPWIAGFIFTRCGGICPALTTRMDSLQKQLDAGATGPIRLVSISVDPEHDRPEVLNAYARRFGAERESWLFLTGSRPAIYRLVHDGFKLMMVELTAEQQASAREPIAHSDRLVLVDRRFQIRGYYRGPERLVLDRLRRDLAGLEPAADAERR